MTCLCASRGPQGCVRLPAALAAALGAAHGAPLPPPSPY